MHFAAICYLKKNVVKQKLIATHSSLISDTVGQFGHDRTSWTSRTKMIVRFCDAFAKKTVGQWDSGTGGVNICILSGLRLSRPVPPAGTVGISRKYSYLFGIFGFEP